MNLQRFAVGSLVVGWLTLAPAAPAQEAGHEHQPRPFLRKVIQLNDDQLADMEKGEVVTKQLPSPDKPEIAAFGVVKVTGTVDTLRERMRDFQSFRKVPQIPEIGHFSDPPQVEDLAGLDWPDADIDALRRCQVGKCDVKLGTAALERFQREVDWKAPDATAKATALAREQMVSYARAYLAGGTDAMGVIVDKSNPRALSDEFRTLLKNSPYLAEYVAPFNHYLETYPKEKLAGAEDSLFWTKDTFGLKPVVSVYHATIYRSESRPGMLVAIKTLYASHFFNAALEVMAAIPTQDSATRPAFYLLDLFRTRIDPPTGMLSGVLMGKVKGGIEQGVGMNLKNAKARVEGK